MAILDQIDWLTGLPSTRWLAHGNDCAKSTWLPANSSVSSDSPQTEASSNGSPGLSDLVLTSTVPAWSWNTGVMIPGAPGGGTASAKGGAGGGGSTGGGGTTFAPYIAGDLSTNYNIELTFLGSGWTTDYYNEAIAMAELICDIIKTDIQDYTLQYRKGRTIVSDFIDDIEINLTLNPIDGVGGILGQAGPEYWRPTTIDYQLVLEGSIQLDSADAQTFLNQNLFDDILFHEMLHVIGLGTIWPNKQLINGSTYTYTGAEGNDAFLLSGFSGQLLVEDDGGGGTAGGHWEEGTDRTAMDPEGYLAGSEIMTGYVNDSNWLSWVTIASLEDLGYGTIWDSNLNSPIDPVALRSIDKSATMPTQPTIVVVV